jgi:2-polyprenyl-3-methyl-5-hydroxy-6-metoxy-1,4-benzoquinol methylase
MKLKALFEYIKFRLRGYSAPDTESFAFVKPGMLVFDIGANRGNYTKVFLSKGARVIAVEPQEACVDFLKLRYTFSKNDPKFYT